MTTDAPVIDTPDSPRPIDLPGAPGSNTGHGHVYPRPDGARARCGGPGLCRSCRADEARKAADQRAALDQWLNERDNLRGRIDELAAEVQMLATAHGIACDERDHALAERDALHAVVEVQETAIEAGEALRAELAVTRTERDELVQLVAARSDELDELRVAAWRAVRGRADELAALGAFLRGGA